MRNRNRSVFDSGGFFFLWVLSWVALIAAGTVLAGAFCRVMSSLFNFGWNLL
jgi:hypothetical protein